MIPAIQYIALLLFFISNDDHSSHDLYIYTQPHEPRRMSNTDSVQYIHVCTRSITWLRQGSNTVRFASLSSPYPVRSLLTSRVSPSVGLIRSTNLGTATCMAAEYFLQQPRLGHTIHARSPTIRSSYNDCHRLNDQHCLTHCPRGAECCPPQGYKLRHAALVEGAMSRASVGRNFTTSHMAAAGLSQIPPRYGVRPELGISMNKGDIDEEVLILECIIAVRCCSHELYETARHCVCYSRSDDVIGEYTASTLRLDIASFTGGFRSSPLLFSCALRSSPSDTRCLPNSV